jgi:hypothetical protein
MGKASSAKKVARAARAGGNRRAGQRRALGFPVAIGVVILVGLLLIFVARDRRNANAFPEANKDHVHSAVDIYTCVLQAAPSVTTTTTVPGSTDSTASGDTTTTTEVPTTTTAPTSTTLMAENDVHGQFAAPPVDVKPDELGIHSHGDGLIHIHPFVTSAAGRNATLGVFLDQVGISMKDNELVLPDGSTFTEGKNLCEGGKQGTVQVAKWNKATDAANGAKPDQIFTSGFDKIRLGANQAYMIAFMPDGSTFKDKPDVADRIAKVSDLNAANSAASSASNSESNSSTGSSGSSSSDTSSSGAATSSSSP